MRDKADHAKRGQARRPNMELPERGPGVERRRTVGPEAAWQRERLAAVTSRPMAASGDGVPQCCPTVPNV